jgi:transcriptional regulator with XRE-family HTH domain
MIYRISDSVPDVIIGQRILLRLEVVGISQAELARRVKLTQSTINGLIRGEQRSSTKLPAIARELQTTPAYLTGETDDPSSDVPDFELSSEDREVLDLLTKLPKPEKSAFVLLLRSVANR